MPTIEPRKTHEVASSFRAIDGYYRYCDSARYPVDFQVVSYTLPTCFWSVVGELVDFFSRNSIVGGVGVAQSKVRHLSW
jgi:hypothetical protein